MVFTWRRQYREQGSLVPVVVEPDRVLAPLISPLALEAVKRIDVLFDIERAINGESAEHRIAVRRELSAPVLADLKGWMETERRKLSKHSPVAKAMDCMLRRWELFARVLDDGRICLTNNAAERALRRIALGRKSWLFCGSDRGGDVHADRHRQAQQCRPAGLTRRRSRPDRGDAADPARRTPSLELGSGTEAGSRRIEPAPAKAEAASRPALHRGHQLRAKLNLKYPSVLGGCLPSTHRVQGSFCWRNGRPTWLPARPIPAHR